MRMFFSYAREDKAIVEKLAEMPPFITTWIDLQDLSGAEGRELDPAIKTAIDNSHVLIAVLSKHAVKSKWVRKEINWALSREQERQKGDPDRRFVLPVKIDPSLNLSKMPKPFSTLAARLSINVKKDDAGIQAGRAAIENALFRWTCEWINHLEPEGDKNRKFVEAFGKDLVEFQTRLLAVKAALSWPLLTLVREDSVAHLISVKDQYNEFTKTFIPGLTTREDEIRWRFGSAALKAFTQLSTFLQKDVYQGTAFALNDIIESINSYEQVLKDNPELLLAAESRRQARIAALDPVITELIRRTSAYIDILRP